VRAHARIASTKEEERRFVPCERLAVSSVGVRGSLGLQADGGEGESKKFLDRSPYSADASTGVGAEQRAQKLNGRFGWGCSDLSPRRK